MPQMGFLACFLGRAERCWSCRAFDIAHKRLLRSGEYMLKGVTTRAEAEAVLDHIRQTLLSGNGL
jgi:hypothetical protein